VVWHEECLWIVSVLNWTCCLSIATMVSEITKEIKVCSLLWLNNAKDTNVRKACDSVLSRTSCFLKYMNYLYTGVSL
jgi:hypothetical protein